jgi:hypothetical protein
VIASRNMAVLAVIFAASGFSTAHACIPPSAAIVRQFSDVIVEGTFFVDSSENGKGRIVAKRVTKGVKKRVYHVQWLPNPEDTFQPHELDCIVTPTENGTFHGFNLSRIENGRYEIIGGWQRAKKGE